MGVGKIVQLRARPTRSALLSFNVEGIVGERSAELGQAVTAFDFTSFYAGLGGVQAGNPARLAYDAAAIRGDATVQASALAALRAEDRRAVLDRAIGTRANAYYQKYANQVAIIAQMRAVYAPAGITSKPARLAALAQLAQNQADLLAAAYTADGRLSVVRSTTSDLSSTTQSSGDACSTTAGLAFGNNTANGYQNATTDNFNNSVSNDLTVGSAGTSDAVLFSNGTTFGSSLASTSSSGFNVQSNTGTGRTHSCGSAVTVQSAANTDYGYRVPSLESAALNQRAQVSLADEQFAQFIAGQTLPYLEAVFQNELQGLDLEAKRLQVRYLDTILMSPIAGIVTGVFKGLGDRVKAGEPVVRVEDNQSVFLVGTIVHRGRVSVGAMATVNSPLFSIPGATPTPIPGTVAAVRGHPTDDDRWDVAIRCANVDAGGNEILPLHYQFDRDDTTITLP